MLSLHPGQCIGDGVLILQKTQRRSRTRLEAIADHPEIGVGVILLRDVHAQVRKGERIAVVLV